MRHEFEEEDSFVSDMEFGEIIRKKRRLLGMNQGDFGDYIGGYHQHTISTWETGIKTPPFSEAIRIIEFLGGAFQYVNLDNDENELSRENHNLKRYIYDSKIAY